MSSHPNHSNHFTTLFILAVAFANTQKQVFASPQSSSLALFPSPFRRQSNVPCQAFIFIIFHFTSMEACQHEWFGKHSPRGRQRKQTRQSITVAHPTRLLFNLGGVGVGSRPDPPGCMGFSTNRRKFCGKWLWTTAQFGGGGPAPPPGSPAPCRVDGGIPPPGGLNQKLASHSWSQHGPPKQAP